MRSIFFILTNLILTQVFGQTTIDQAKTFFNNNQFEKSKALLLTINDKSQDYASARYYLGRISYNLKLYDAAADYFEEAIKKNDRVADFYNWLGNTYGAKAQESNPITQGILAPKMKNAWEKAIELDPKNIDALWALIQFYTRAPGFMGGSTEKAKVIATQIGKVNVSQGHMAMATVYLSEKKTVEAEKEYVELVKQDPSKYLALVNFYVTQKRYERAFILLEDNLAKYPNDFITIYQIGKTSAVSGLKLDKGEECLKKYLNYTPKRNEPSHAGANMRLAQIYEKKGNFVEAKKLYKSAITADGTLKEAKEGLERVSKKL